jgi:hypothetical protein
LPSGNELLRELHLAGTFNPTPDSTRLGDYYVSFAELAPPAQLERRLRDTLMSGDSVSLVGGRGVGKSSMLESVLGPLAESFAPILVRVALEPDRTILDPERFARHVCTTIIHYAREAANIGDDDARAALREAGIMSRPQATTHVRFGAPRWMLTGELSRDVRQTAETVADARSVADIWDVIGRVLHVIRFEELRPVLLFDDTDRWLRIPGDDHTTRVTAFFRQLRNLAELHAPLAVAVHTEYLAMPAYSTLTQGIFTRQIDLPRIQTRSGLRLLLDRRIACDSNGAGVADVFTPAAVDRLFAHYAEKPDRTLRAVVAIASAALSEAAAYGKDEIDETTIEDAIADRPLA